MTISIPGYKYSLNLSIQAKLPTHDEGATTKMLEQDEEMPSSHSLSDQEEMEEIERQLLDEQIDEKRQAGIIASQYHTLPQAELINRSYAVSVLFISKH